MPLRRLRLSNKKEAPKHPPSSPCTGILGGEFHPRFDEHERYSNWKIPVINTLVEGPQTRIEVQAFCVQQLLEAAAHLSRAAV
ncbi:DUF3916 domain-containing protein [Pseudomonas kribbensis]|uniref:DUF3916 domain-containing protein n=1 Tax=Pseudomonas kribbensis TaxID=1628086 RepID=UPI001FC9DB38|nr:DUF3916 domain-containing protein [Pseudomonas kribbensis]